MTREHQTFLNDDCEGSAVRTVIYQVAEALPTREEQFFNKTRTDQERSYHLRLQLVQNRRLSHWARLKSLEHQCSIELLLAPTRAHLHPVEGVPYEQQD